ncbi:uncharacterized protein LOC133198195 [Saccostrea echinata]|uniref:uncharacterized protein LOC133198195 n=1 Tax=Saccostrea echinata TaxID=191078 RepID=UPI002A808DEF|nr:uncharacterized protein LOC133198195 [Saccostrea echinata]
MTFLCMARGIQKKKLLLTMIESDRKLRALMDRCRERGLVLNKDKLRLRQKEVRFIGHLVTSEGLKPDPEKVKAVKEIPNPENVAGVRRFLGFVNYLSKFLPSLSDLCEPLRKHAQRRCMELSDHKPLEIILRKPLHIAPKRLQRMLLRLQKYTIHLAYHPGKEMFLADTLSRAYLRNNEQTGTLEEETKHLARFLPVIKDRIQELRQETQADKTLVKLTKVILSGWPEISAYVSAPLQPYFNIRDELTVQGGIVFIGERILIPETMRMDMLRRIHSSHIGVEGSVRRAREYLFWLGMTKDVKDFVTKCDTCRSFDDKQRKEALVDYLRNTKSKTVIQKLKALFARYGIPGHLVSDNGSQFASTEFSSLPRNRNSVV